jgi:hypothetical protein
MLLIRFWDQVVFNSPVWGERRDENVAELLVIDLDLLT